MQVSVAVLTTAYNLADAWFTLRHGIGISRIFSPLSSFYRLRWSRGSVLAFGTQVRGFKPGRSRRKKSSARLSSEGK